jgi:Putative protein-S-isoprenylcysteine methyltransferase
MIDLNKKAFGGLFFLIMVLAVMLFVPAWTFYYWQAWIFLAIFSVSVSLISLYLMKKDPKLLERRVSAGPFAEKEKSEKIIQTLTAIGFVAMLVVPSLDHRLHWSYIPSYLSAAGDILVVIGLLIIFFVYKGNTFTSATIEVYPDQKVISTGLYSLVRHPMYMGALVMFIGMILALASWWGFVVYTLMMPALIWRLLDEEKFLLKNLAGYSQYRDKVRYRLIPWIW